MPVILAIWETEIGIEVPGQSGQMGQETPLQLIAGSGGTCLSKLHRRVRSEGPRFQVSSGKKFMRPPSQQQQKTGLVMHT
jgi:hypothetical protein